MHHRMIEFVVGLFMIAGAVALLTLAFKVSGLTGYPKHGYYVVYAEFDNIGGLKDRSPVRVAGVRIGQVGTIRLDPKTLRARVNILIDKSDHDIPIDSSASIMTEGLLGSNYISVIPGFEDQMLKEGDTLENTHSALILENLVGQLIFTLKGGEPVESRSRKKGK